MMPRKEIKSDPVRLNGAIDLELMQGAHVVCVGIGGAMGLCEDLVRCGIGKLTAIDFDEVDATNIHTQGFDLAHIGLPKVDALGDRLQALNQELDYTGIQMDFLEPSDDEVDEIVSDADILLMMTDNFHCQARGNLISMRTSIPTVFAAAYHRGHGAEVSFNIPGTTAACHRCATWSRYEAYEDGFENDVGSAGSCVMITHYLNAVLGHVILAIMHRDASDCEFAGWFDKEWSKNLIQVRLSPKLWEGEETLFDREYGASPFSFAFEALWSSITPVSEDIYGITCPDCLGTGGRLKETDDPEDDEDDEGDEGDDDDGIEIGSRVGVEDEDGDWYGKIVEFDDDEDAVVVKREDNDEEYVVDWDSLFHDD